MVYRFKNSGPRIYRGKKISPGKKSSEKKKDILRNMSWGVFRNHCCMKGNASRTENDLMPAFFLNL